MERAIQGNRHQRHPVKESESPEAQSTPRVCGPLKLVQVHVEVLKFNKLCKFKIAVIVVSAPHLYSTSVLTLAVVDKVHNMVSQ